MPQEGRVTPSNFAKILTYANYEKILKDPKLLDAPLSTTAEKYLISVVRGALGVKDREINAKSLDWGKTYEPIARLEYELTYFKVIPEITEPIYHPEFPFVCGKPDGLIGTDEILEIKCPENADNHLLNVLQGEQIEDYYAQMQGYMWITGRNNCRFCSFHPDFPEHLRLNVIDVPRDDQYIEVLQHRILFFYKKVEEMLARLGEKV